MSWHLIGFINSSLFKRTMNKTISLAAIAMVAVIMGMSAVVPAAMAAKPEVEQRVCHLDHDINGNGIKDEDADDVAWVALIPNSHGAVNGHVNGHGDILIADDDEAALCVSNQDGHVHIHG